MSSAPGSTPAAVVGAVAAEPRFGAAYTAPADAGASTDFWSLLVNAETSDQLCQAWLGILCQWIPGTQAGVLLLLDEGENYAPAAVWPDPERDMSALAPVAEEALVERRGIVRETDDGQKQCAYPLLSSDLTYGVVILQMLGRGEGPVREALRVLHWGAGWLVGLFDRRQLVDRDHRLERSGLLQDLLLGVMAEYEPEAAARWVVNRLAEALPCRQAMIGFPRGADVDVLCVSGTASFEPRSNLLAAARAALQSVIDAGTAERHPPEETQDGAPLLSAGAAADYAHEADAKAVLVLPLVNHGRTLGALLLDFETPLAPGTAAFAATLALGLAPGLELQEQARRSLIEHAGASFTGGLRALVGPRHVGRKLVLILVALAIAAAALVETDYRVRAPATVEGRVQRAAVAPFEGFIHEADRRAGDVVKQGDLLARLDDRDLVLEQAKWAAESELADRKLREAMAKQSAVAVRIAEAEAAQARAELALVREKLSRVAITAPFDGVVVKGDLSQQLGAPVEQGKVLFEVAPLDAYRVVLKVDERDIVEMKTKAPGELVLAGLPGARFPIQVTKIAPVTTAEDGRNSFRVEAEVAGAAARVQPGMEGVGKVVAGRHSVLWIVFHRLSDWARYTWWTLGL
ncbi:MAG: HlyD family efflux transporter periplasmic adaptor subunit [Gammaproteobacteria bacterium]|nr:HlyD family efflux transporter periplasmic adaptor subunit [Gammaproteobacteria bacterium]